MRALGCPLSSERQLTFSIIYSFLIKVSLYSVFCFLWFVFDMSLVQWCSLSSGDVGVDPSYSFSYSNFQINSLNIPIEFRLPVSRPHFIPFENGRGSQYHNI